MFHDKNLHQNLLTTLAFDLNADACKLALLVEWYRARGERTLPVSYLKRLGFTRRQWELATKGTREKSENGKLKDPRPAKDGCEAVGLVSEHKAICEHTGRPKTYWVIGQIDKEALEAIRREREASAFDVIEDRPPEAVEAGEPVEPSVKASTQSESEAEYDRGYADGQANGYERGVDDTRCRLEASIDQSSRDAGNELLVDKTQLSTVLAAFERVIAENEELQEECDFLEFHLKDRFDTEFDARPGK